MVLAAEEHHTTSAVPGPSKKNSVFSQLTQQIASIVLDTITTRFLLLFLFLLTIPLVTVIIFTSTLLANHLEDSGINELMLSDLLLKKQAAHQQEMLNTLGTFLGKTPQAPTVCQTLPSLLCLPVQKAGLSNQELSNLSPSPLNQPFFYTHHQKDLYVLRPVTFEQNNNQLYLLGYPLNENWLNSLYQSNPQLKTIVWLVPEPTSNHSLPQFISSSNAPTLKQAPQILKQLSFQTETQPFLLTVDKTQYQIYQTFLYSLRNEKIARVVHIFPLTQQENLLSQYYLGIYIIAVASFVFSILLAMLAGRTITQPLLKLIRQVNALSHATIMKEEVSTSSVQEIKQLSSAFNQMIKRLRQEHKMKDEFVATLTHDLKVPLIAEKQTLTYMQKQTYGPLNEEQAEVVSTLLSSNRSCLSLVNGLLEVYRYDSGEVSLVFETFNLLALLQETMSEVQPLATEKKITMEIASKLDPDGIDALAYADRLEMKRVLHNLLSNAITNTPPHGKIHCSIDNRSSYGSDILYKKVSTLQYTSLKNPVYLDGRLMVTVQDSGIGFGQEDLNTLFQQFAGSRGRNPMSIGLGLYNCYQVIKAHQGTLWVETTEGEGSAISFVLPQNRDIAEDRRVYSDRRKHLS